jgi:tellurite resistance protein TerC
MTPTLFPFFEYWWLYLAFSSLVVGLLAIDLSFHRQAHAISAREALLWMGVWIALALAFNAALYLFASSRVPPDAARRLSLEFLAGYIVEESLSLDNMFVFALIFRHFAVPGKYQHRVLFYGVLGAMVFRAIFIGIGSALIRFEWILAVFGMFLVITGVRMAFSGEKQIEPGKNPIVRWASRFLPIAPQFDGGRFVSTAGGVRRFTPLVLVLLLLETTDILFAVDSVPAVFAVTREPFIVYTSNVFAILGLRAMYFLLAGAMDRFHMLRYGLSVVLVFVGVKMTWLDHWFGGRFPIVASLAFIGGVIGAAIVLSLVFPSSRAPRVPRWSALLPRLMGAVCLLLATLSFIFAATGPLPALAEAGAVSLCVSGACYAFCGALLIRSR